MRYYLDTSIWLDIIEKRGKNGIHALALVTQIIKKGEVIGYSELNTQELKHLGYTQDQIQNLLSTMKPLIKVHIFKQQMTEARNIAKKRDIPRRDVLHAILCRDNGFQLISRDAHFEKMREITLVKKPEDFIVSSSQVP